MIGPHWLGVLQPGSAEWRMVRRTRIGGSEIASVIGLGFSSRYELHYVKAGVIEPKIDNEEDLYWGTAQEPVILDRFEADLAVRAPEANLQRSPGSFVHPDHDWMLATPDAMLWPDRESDDGEVIEVKNANRADGWSWDVDGFPTPYRCQLLWTMHVMGVRRGRLIAKIGLSDYRDHYRIDLDTDPDAEDDLAFMIERGEQFVADVRDRNDPEPDDGSMATWQAAKRMHPEIDKGTIAEIDPDLAAEYLMAYAAVKADEIDKRAAEALILHRMGTAQNAHAVAGGEVDHQRFAYRTWKTRPDGSPGTPYLAVDQKTYKQTIKEVRGAEAEAEAAGSHK